MMCGRECTRGLSQKSMEKLPEERMIHGVKTGCDFKWARVKARMTSFFKKFSLKGGKDFFFPSLVQYL